VLSNKKDVSILAVLISVPAQATITIRNANIGLNIFLSQVRHWLQVPATQGKALDQLPSGQAVSRDRSWRLSK
jgi:hypothetical protein